MKKTRTLLKTLLLAVGLSFFVFPTATVEAAGESYAYDGSEQIVVSGGDLTSTATLTRFDNSSLQYDGAFTVTYDPTWWFGGEVTCYVNASVTVSGPGSSSGTLSVSLETGSTIGSSSPCQDEEALDFFQDSAVTINTSNYNEEELAFQREINVTSHDVDYMDPAGQDTVTLETRSGNVLDSANVSLDVGNRYDSHTFTDVDPGNYSLCSTQAATCIDVVKVAYSRLNETVGEYQAFDQAGEILVNIEYTISNLQDGQVINPIPIALVQNGQVLQTASTESRTYEQETDTGLSPLVDTTLFDNVTFQGAEPGTYQVCNESQTTCADVTKEASETAEVTLALSGTEVLNTGAAPENEPNCESENSAWLGWILCPVMRGMIGFLDDLTVDQDGTGFLGNILNFDLNEGNQREALSVVWSGFRALANLLFAIAFMVIIYSAASGNVLSAYDVKRLLPRVVIAAIGVQLSFEITTWLLDFSNDLGRGAGNLLLAPLPGDQSILAASNLEFISGLAVGILILILTIVVAIASIMGILLMAIVFLIRNMAILILIVLAPIAFVAWILPNSENLFKRWWQMYIQLLMIFPIAALFFASGKLIAYIWIGSGDSLGPDNLGAILIGTLALFAPYYAAPKLMTFAGSTIKSIGNGVENAKNRVSQTEFSQRAKKRAKGMAYGAVDKASRYKAPEGAGKFRKAFEKAGQKGVGSITGTKTYSRLSARASEAVSKLDSEDAGAARIKLLEGETERRAEATMQAKAEAKNEGLEEGSAEYNMKINSAADKASINYLAGVLEDENASDFDKRAAANILGVKFSHDETAVGALRDVVQGGRAGDAKQQRLAAQIVEDNAGVYMPGMGHLLKGDGFVEAGVEATNLSSGSVKDISNRAKQEHVRTLATQFIAQASNPSTRNQTDLTKVSAMYGRMLERAADPERGDDEAGNLQRGISELESQFEFTQDDKGDWHATHKQAGQGSQGAPPTPSNPGPQYGQPQLPGTEEDNQGS